MRNATVPVFWILCAAGLSLAAAGCGHHSSSSGADAAPGAQAPVAAEDHAGKGGKEGKGACKGKDCAPEHEICLNVFCSFHGKDGDHDQDGEMCEAAAVFQKEVDPDGDEIHDSTASPHNPAFAVACEHRTIFQGPAHRYTDDMGTRLQAEAGPFPAVILPPGALHEGHREVPALLELSGERKVPGSCQIYTGEPLF